MDDTFDKIDKAGKSKKKKRDKVYQIRLTEDEAYKLRDFGMETGDTMANIVRTAINTYINLRRNGY